MNKLYCFFGILFSIAFFDLKAQSPVADFTSDKTTGCGQLVVRFFDSSSNNPTYWRWDMGNGTIIQGNNKKNPVYAYPAPGVYTVILTATNTSGSGTITKAGHIRVFGIPQPQFSATPLSGCSPMSVSFTDQSVRGVAPSTNINSWLWNFGDGNSSSQQNPIHTYSAAGTYQVTLEVSDGNNCSKNMIKTSYVTVNEKPVASFTSSDPYSCVPPHTVNFNNTSAGATNFMWYFGDGATSTQENPTHNYTASGAYTVRLIVNSSQGCKDTIDMNNYVEIGTFYADFNATPDSVCVGSAIQFNVPIANLTQVSWDFGNSDNSFSNPVNYTYPNPGNYTVTVTITNGAGCTADTVKTVTVLPLPVIDFTSDKTISCMVPFEVNFNAIITPPGTAQSYLWSFGDGSISGTTANPAHTYTQFGADTVSLTIVDAFGCTSTITKPDYIESEPLIASFITDKIDGCKALTVTFTDLSTSIGSIVNWDWNFGDGNTLTGTTPTAVPAGTNGGLTSGTYKDPKHTYPDVGVYIVTLIVTDTEGCEDSVELEIKAGTPPLTSFDPKDLTIVCHGAPVSFIDLSTDTTNAWIWDFGGNGSSENQNPIHTFTDTGYFYIELIAKYNGCPDTLRIDSLIYVLPSKPLFTATPEIICEQESPYEVQFNDDSYHSPYHTSEWLWSFGDANTLNSNGAAGTDPVSANGGLTTGTYENPQHTYQNSGFYNVKLVVKVDYPSHPDFPGNSHFPMECKDSLIKNTFVEISDINPGFSQSDTIICQSERVDFIDATTLNTEIIKWEWNFGDGNTLTSIQDSINIPAGTNGGVTTGTYQNPSHTYSDFGIYDVSLIIHDALGCSDTITMDSLITVRQLPTVGFFADALTGCTALEVNFTDTTICYAPASIAAWNWNFGDGSPGSVNQNPLHIYSTRGLYDVSLSVTDSEGCSSNSISNSYIAPTMPYPDFTTINTTNTTFTHCYYDSVYFINSSTGAISYFWDFGDGNTSTDPNPSHFYGGAGTTVMQVSLTATDINNCDSTIIKEITISRPIADFSADQTITDCPPHIVQFENLSTPDVSSYVWSFGDSASGSSNNTSVIADPSHTYNFADLYDVQLIITNNFGCVDTLIKLNFIEVGGPSASFEFNPKSGCAPLEVTFVADNTSNVASFLWVFGDGNSIDGDSAVHFYGGGTWTPVLQITDLAGCSVSIVPDEPVKVTDATVDFISDISVSCIPRTVNFFDNSSSVNGTISSWTWDFGDGSTDIGMTTSHYYGLGLYDVTLEINVNGCIFKITKPDFIQIFDPPSFSVSKEYEITCPPVLVNFNVKDTFPYPVDSWYWTFGGSLDTTKSPYQYYNDPGSYIFDLTIQFNINGELCPTTVSDALTLVFDSIAKADFVTDTNHVFPKTPIQFTDSSTNSPVKWKWIFGDGTESLEENPAHSFKAPGDFKVMLVVENMSGCTDTIIKTISIMEKIYIPNVFTPNGDGKNDFFIVEAPGMVTFYAGIFNRWGQKIFEWENENLSWDGRTTSGENASEGIYFYVVKLGRTNGEIFNQGGTITLLR